MSDPTEDSTTATLTVALPETTVLEEKKPLLLCLTCEGTISDEDLKITCTKAGCGKTTCISCVELLLRVLFSEPELTYPLRCGACNSPYQDGQIDGLLRSEGMYEQYMACVLPLFWSEACLETDEALARCK